VFVYNQYEYATGRHTAVLLSPLLIAWFDGFETWIQARTHTLAVYLLIRNTFYQRVRAATDVSVFDRASRSNIDNQKGKHPHESAARIGLDHVIQALSFVTILRLLQINNRYIEMAEGVH